VKSQKGPREAQAGSENQKKARGKAAKKRAAVAGKPEIKMGGPTGGRLPDRKPADREAVYCGFYLDGSRMASLKDVRDPQIPTRSIGELSHAEIVTLVLERLRRDKTYPPLRMLGAKGLIDKRRAIREVGKLSPIGLHLIEIEKEYIQLQLTRR
jgi:hypothetical protein